MYTTLPVLIALLLLFTVLPGGSLRDARFVSVVDGAFAVAAFTVSALLLLSQTLQGGRRDILVYGFLTAALLRFMGSTTEDVDDSVWLHRICALALSVAFVLASLPRKILGPASRTILALVCGTSLAVGVALLIFPPFFQLAVYGTNRFSVSNAAVSLVASALFFTSVLLDLKEEKESSPTRLAAMLFGVVALLYPLTSLWSSHWWLIQAVELGTTLYVVINLFIEDTRARLKLMASNEDLGRFAAVASHDLKEPLRTISMYLSLVDRENKGKLSRETEANLNFAREGAQQLNALLDALLAFARSDAREAEFQLVDLNAVLQTAMNNLRPYLVETDAMVTCERLPCVRGEPAFLIQLFQNLIANAIKYRNRARRAEISVFVGEHGEDWCIGVRDNGIGFSADKALVIFEPFRRLHGKAEFPGTGLGLATCKRIVESHGGTIWAESSPGQGSTFIFTLPKGLGSTSSAGSTAGDRSVSRAVSRA